MLWSLLKVVIFFALAGLLAYVGLFVLETPGEVRIAFGNREWQVTPFQAVVALLVFALLVWALLLLAGLLVAVGRYLTGDETALTRYLDRGRQRRGFEALTRGFMALATGDAPEAEKMASKAERLLGEPNLTRLINAQAAEMAGRTDRAETYYKRMLGDDATRFVGVHGLLRQRLADGDSNTALKLAEKAFALRPRHKGVLSALFGLQSETGDWTGARKTLKATVRAQALTRDVGTRRDAVLLVAEAQEAEEAGEPARARTAALEANRLAPGLVPAAVLAARHYVAEGQARRASQVLRKAWELDPHPDIAAAFAKIAPEESAEARLRRFQTLMRTNPTHAETIMLHAELELAAENFPAARKALGDLVEREPSTRALAIMAAIERGEGAEDRVVQAWLAKAVTASRGPQWICDVDGKAYPEWRPVTDGGFDTLSWKAVPGSEDLSGSAAAMLPIVTGLARAESAAANGSVPDAEMSESDEAGTGEAATDGADAETSPPAPDGDAAKSGDGEQPARAAG